MTASRCTLALVGTKADYQRGSLEIRHTNVSNPFTSIFSANTCGQVVAADYVTGGIAVQGVSTTTATAQPFFFGGIHGSTAPTTALLTFQGQKNNGTGGYAVIANTEKLVRFRNLNTEIIAILGSRAVGIGNTAPTSTTSLTVRGQGTTTGISFRTEDSGGAEQFRIQDNGQTFLFEDSGVSAGSHSLILSGAKNEYWRPSISFRSSQISSTFSGFWAGDNSAMGIIAPGNNPVGGGLFFNGVTTSGSTAYYGVQFGGYQGSTAPTVANTLIFGAKWSGTGTTLTDLAAGEILFQCTNNATGRFYVFGGGGVGIRNSAPTNTNGLTIRGQGTTTALLFLAETSAGTARFTVRDDGAYAFAGGTVGAAATGYTTFTNLTTDRTCDANATTVEELADILGTLIVDLKTKGIIAA